MRVGRGVALVGLLWSIGCSTIPGGDGGTIQDVRTIAEWVDGLQQSPDANKRSRKLLKHAGAQATQVLTNALLVAIDRTDADAVTRSTRMMHALRELRTPAAVPVCEKILMSSVGFESRVRGALLSEAIMATCDLFPDRSAVDLYVRFVMEREHYYVVVRDITLHWGGTVRENCMTADVLYGLTPLVRTRDLRTRMVFLKLLKLFTGGALEHSEIWTLEPDGFTIALRRWDPVRAKRQLQFRE